MTTVRYLNALNAWEGTILQALQGNASVLLVQDVFLLRSTPYMIHKLEYEDSRPAFIEAHQLEDDGHTANGSTRTIRLSAHDERIITVPKIVPYSLLYESYHASQGNQGSKSHLQASSSEITAHLHRVVKAAGDAATKILDRLKNIFHPSALNKTSGLRSMKSELTSLSAELRSSIAGMSRIARALESVFLVFAAYIFACGDTQQAISPRNNERASTQSMTMQDVEDSPLKARPPATAEENKRRPVNTDTAAEFSRCLMSVVEAVQDVCRARIGPLLEKLPVPLTVPVAAWAGCLEALYGAQYACKLLVDSLCDTQQRQPSEAVEAVQRELTAMISEYSQRGALSQVEWLEHSALDSVARQQWGSDSQYMRDRKITPALTSLCVTLRAAVWDMYKQTAPLHWGQEQRFYGEISTLSLQMLLTATVQVCRTYTGTYTDSSHGDGSNSSSGSSDNTTERWVSPSRARMAQWRRDLGYFMYMALDTLGWIISVDTARFTLPGNRSGTASTIPGGIAKLCESMAHHQYKAGHYSAGNSEQGKYLAGVAQRQALLSSEGYGDQAAIVTELVQVLRYLALCFYIATEADVDALLCSLQDCIVVFLNGKDPAVEDAPSTASENALGVSSSLWDELLLLVQSLSACEYFTALLSGDRSIQNLQDSAETQGATSPHTSASSAVRRPARRYDLTGDVLAGCGLHSFSFPANASNVERELYSTDLFTAVSGNDINSGDGVGVQASVISSEAVPSPPNNLRAAATLSAETAVAFHRWSSLTVSHPEYLLQMVSRDTDTLISVFSEVNDSFAFVRGTPAPDPIVVARLFLAQALQSRYEVAKGAYPPLTSVELAWAEKVNGYIADLSLNH